MRSTITLGCLILAVASVRAQHGDGDLRLRLDALLRERAEVAAEIDAIAQRRRDEHGPLSDAAAERLGRWDAWRESRAREAELRATLGSIAGSELLHEATIRLGDRSGEWRVLYLGATGTGAPEYAILEVGGGVPGPTTSLGWSLVGVDGLPIASQATTISVQPAAPLILALGLEDGTPRLVPAAAEPLGASVADFRAATRSEVVAPPARPSPGVGLVLSPSLSAVRAAGLHAQRRDDDPTNLMVRDALDWLVAQQEEPGRWPGADRIPSAVALLAILGRGEALEHGPDRTVVLAGVAELAAWASDARALGACGGLERALVAAVLSEFATLTRGLKHRRATRDALESVAEHQEKDGGWRDGPTPSPQRDALATAWSTIALALARDAVIRPEPDVLERTARRDGIGDASLAGPVAMTQLFAPSAARAAAGLAHLRARLVTRLASWDGAVITLDLPMRVLEILAAVQLGGDLGAVWHERLGRLAIAVQGPDPRGAFATTAELGRIEATAWWVIGLTAPYRYARRTHE